MEFEQREDSLQAREDLANLLNVNAATQNRKHSLMKKHEQKDMGGESVVDVSMTVDS